MNDRNVATPTGKPWSAMTVIGARDLQPHRLRARRARQWKLPSPGNHGVHQPLLNRVHRTILYFFAPFRGGSGLPELSARRIVISANMTGAPLSAACINIAAANRHSGWSCFTFGSAAMNSPASRSVLSTRPPGTTIASSNGRDQPLSRSIMGTHPAG